MKLETLKVNNIRSIKKLELEFPDTTILFYGDIGSGKSSILKAIEFGLFGTMGELSSSSLLRRGQNNAQVELTFSIGDDRYIIHRELKKKIKDDKETISQPEGWLIENDIKTSYTATELRTRILELLNYSTTKYKSTSKKCVDIFRYTVYTPQEEIKEILKADPKERFEILKDVLEIEKYENSLKNLENIKKDISKQLRDIDYDIKTIGSPEEAILEIEKGIATKKEKIKTQT
jgi:exonuclease SbcC